MTLDHLDPFGNLSLSATVLYSVALNHCSTSGYKNLTLFANESIQVSSASSDANFLSIASQSIEGLTGRPSECGCLGQFAVHTWLHCP